MGRLKLRTFIAVPLEAAVRRRIVALQEELAAAAPAVKWVEPENLHVTMLFLGEVDARDVVDICRVVREVTTPTPPFGVEVTGVGCFPNLRRPRTLWVGVGGGRAELVAIHDRIETALLKLAGYRREDREFTPHITLGRLKSDEVGAAFRDLLKQQAEWDGGRQDVSEIQVMSSDLTADGPQYSIVSREKLQGRAAALE